LHGEDSSELTLIDTEHLRECSPSGAKEDGVELAVVPKEDSQAFRDGEDGVAMRDVFDNFAVNVLGELDSSLRSTGRAHPTALAGEGDKERVLASITIHPCGTVSEDSAVKVLVEGLYYLIPQAPILVLEAGFPLELEVIPRVVDDLVEHRGFGGASPVVLELLLCLLPRVTPEHTGWFGEVRGWVVSELGRRTERDSGEVSGFGGDACA
jgi:hypothetical protein